MKGKPCSMLALILFQNWNTICMAAKHPASILDRIISLIQIQQSAAVSTTLLLQVSGILMTLAFLFIIILVKMDGFNDLPRFAGQTGDAYRRWKAKVLWLLAGTADDKRKLLAPLIIEQFQGEPSDHFSEVDPNRYRADNGVDILLQELDLRYGTYSEIELSRTVAEFFQKLRRRNGESATSFAARFRTQEAGMLAMVNAELQRERERRNTAASAKHRSDYVSHTLAMRKYRAQYAVYEAEYQR